MDSLHFFQLRLHRRISVDERECSLYNVPFEEVLRHRPLRRLHRVRQEGDRRLECLRLSRARRAFRRSSRSVRL